MKLHTLIAIIFLSAIESVSVLADAAVPTPSAVESLEYNWPVIISGALVLFAIVLTVLWIARKLSRNQ